MRWIVVLLSLLVFVGCSTSSQGTTTRSPQTKAAWSERVAIVNGAISSKSVTLLVDGVSTKPIYQEPGRVVFDLPAAPFPYETGKNGSALPTSEAEYKDRGVVSVSVVGANIPTQQFKPFGAVVSGELSVLVKLPGAPSSCSAFYNWLSSNASFELVDPANPGISEEDLDTYANNTFCYATVGFKKWSTENAVIILSNGIENAPAFSAEDIVISENIVSSLDGNDAFSYDPNCSQRVFLEEQEAIFNNIDMTFILNEINVTGAPDTGQGVTVAVIDGGVNAPALSSPGQVLNGYNFITDTTQTVDIFFCDYIENGIPEPGEMRGHGMHIAEIISAIAPDANIMPLKVCDREGDCQGSDINRALMTVLNRATPNMLVSMSLGSPELDEVMLRLLQELGSAGIPVVTSAGNTGNFTTHHYPGSFSPNGSDSSYNLSHIFSVSAAGWDGSAWQDVNFNFSNNADIYAPGYELCPDTVPTSIRCGTEPGISGSSFAAPFVAGVLALYKDANPASNIASLRNRLMVTNSQSQAGLPLKMVNY